MLYSELVILTEYSNSITATVMAPFPLSLAHIKERYDGNIIYNLLHFVDNNKSPDPINMPLIHNTL